MVDEEVFEWILSRRRIGKKRLSRSIGKDENFVRRWLNKRTTYRYDLTAVAALAQKLDVPVSIFMQFPDDPEWTQKSWWDIDHSNTFYELAQNAQNRLWLRRGVGVALLPPLIPERLEAERLKSLPLGEAEFASKLRFFEHNMGFKHRSWEHSAGHDRIICDVQFFAAFLHQPNAPELLEATIERLNHWSRERRLSLVILKNNDFARFHADIGKLLPESEWEALVIADNHAARVAYRHYSMEHYSYDGVTRLRGQVEQVVKAYAPTMPLLSPTADKVDLSLSKSSIHQSTQALTDLIRIAERAGG